MVTSLFWLFNDRCNASLLSIVKCILDNEWGFIALEGVTTVIVFIAYIVFLVLGEARQTRARNRLLKDDKAPAKMSLIDRLEERARRFKAFADKFSAAATKAISELVERAIALLHRFANWLVEIANTIKRTLTRVRQAVWWVVEGLLMVSKYYLPGVVCFILAWLHSSWRSFWLSPGFVYFVLVTLLAFGKYDK